MLKRIISSFLIGLIFSVKQASACTVCFYGDPDDPATKALRAGVILLLVFILSLLGLFARFFIIVKKRSQTT